METILITGGAGFIGSNLVRHLNQKAFRLRILDTLTPQIHGAIPQGLDWLGERNTEFIRGSVTDRRIVETALDGATAVVHLAAETGTGQSMYEVARYNEVNSQGTAVLLDILANSNTRTVKRIVLTSSRSVYGEGAYVCDAGHGRVFPASRPAEQLARHEWDPICHLCKQPLRAVATVETDPARPASIYAATKYAQEDLVRVASESLGINYAILRLQNVYGEGQSLKNPYTGILSIFSTKVRRGVQLGAFEDGLETRDFVHVDDVARSIHQCLITSRQINQVINVGSGIATNVLEIATRLTATLGSRPNIRVTAEYRLGDIRHNVADIDRLRTILEYEPRVGLTEGLERFAQWVLTQPLPEDLLDRANAELRARKLMG